MSFVSENLCKKRKSVEKLMDTGGNFSVQEFKLRKRKDFMNNNILCVVKYHFENRSEPKVLAMKV